MNKESTGRECCKNYIHLVCQRSYSSAVVSMYGCFDDNENNFCGVNSVSLSVLRFNWLGWFYAKVCISANKWYTECAMPIVKVINPTK